MNYIEILNYLNAFIIALCWTLMISYVLSARGFHRKAKTLWKTERAFLYSRLDEFDLETLEEMLRYAEEMEQFEACKTLHNYMKKRFNYDTY